jgi:hypothetical protein
MTGKEPGKVLGMVADMEPGTVLDKLSDMVPGRAPDTVPDNPGRLRLWERLQTSTLVT